MAFSPSFYQYIKLTLKEKETPANSITLYIGNRTPLTESTLTIYPALKNISGIGVAQSGAVPELGRGRIDIDNTRDMFGFQKRFIDYLDKYTVLGQEVDIYLAKVNSNDTNISADAVLYWSDTVNGIDFRGDTVTLNLRSDVVANTEFTAKIDPNVFTNASTTALGQSVPIVFGTNQQVKPILVDASATYTNFAYATTLKRQFTNGGVKKLYCKNHTGEYVLVSSDQGSGLQAYNYGDLSTDSYSLPVATANQASLDQGHGGYAFLSDNSQSTADEHGGIVYGACLIVHKRSLSGTFTASTVTDKITLPTPLEWKTGIKVRFTTTGTLPAPLATSTDYYLRSDTNHYVFEDYDDAIAKKLRNPIDITTTGAGTHTATAQIPADEVIVIECYEALYDADIAEYTVGNLITKTEDIFIADLATGSTRIYRSFAKPIVVGANSPVFFAIRTNYQDRNATTYISTSMRAAYRASSATGVTFNVKQTKQQLGISNETSDIWEDGTLATEEIALELYSCTYTDNGTPPVSVYSLPNGLATSYFTITHDNANFTAPDMSSLDFIFEIDGLRDDSSGTITGSANSVLTRPHHIAELLNYTYNGTNWVAGKFNDTLFSSTHAALSATGYYSRAVGGVSQGNQRARQLLNDILSEHACYLTKNTTSREVGLYAWGTQLTDTGQIFDKDILEFRYYIADRSSIVNIARGSYAKALTNFNERRSLSLGGEKSYSGYAEYYYADAGLGQDISAKSYSLYGANENLKNTYNWVSDATTMQNILLGILARNQNPTEILELTLPLYKFYNLNLWQVYEIVTSQLPQTGGTSPNPLSSIYNASAEILYNTDKDLVLAKPYRAQIIRLDYNFNNEAPTVQVTFNLLINKADRT